MIDFEHQIQERYAFSLPEIYKAMRAASCFDAQHEHHLQFTDLEWLRLEAIAGFEFDKHMIDGLIPFAQTLDGHIWAWYPQIDERHAEAVVFCPDEDEVAVLYAPDFQTAIYRMLLDELTNTFLVERASLAQAEVRIQVFIEAVTPFLKPSWVERLQELQERSLHQTQTNFYGVLDEDELADILSTDIAYDRLDEEFCCVKPETT